MTPPPRATLTQLAAADARKYGVPANVFVKQIDTESHFDPNAVSSAGARGIAQFIPSTAHAYGLSNPLDPVASLDAAARYDSALLKQYGSISRALSAYNSGKPDAYLDPKFAGGQTFNYVRSILGGAGGAPAPVSPVAPVGGGASRSPIDGAKLRGLAQLFASTDKQLGLTPLNYAALAARSGLGTSTPTGSSTAVQAVGRVPTATGLAGGFLAAGASYKPGRLDQGHDFQTDPGAPLLAPGDGKVVAVLSDPHGFGPAYPVVHFTSGPYAGQTIYLGHTLAAVKPGQQFRQGQTLSHTGTAPIGNASVPGWAEIGFAPGGVPGSFGQHAPF